MTALLWTSICDLAKMAVLSRLSNIETGALIVIDQTEGRKYVFGQPIEDGEEVDCHCHNNGRISCLEGHEPHIEVNDNGLTHDEDSSPAASPNNNDSLPTAGADNAPKTTNLHKPPTTTLIIRSLTVYPLLLLQTDHGFASSYLLSYLDVRPSLTAFFRLFILNRDTLHNGTTLPSQVLNRLLGGVKQAWDVVTKLLGTQKGELARARRDVRRHYDLGNELFAAFLSKDMTYSCPIWEANPPLGREETLEEAQDRKIKHIISLARLKPTDHVLEIGSGWGSFAITAAKTVGCRVTSLTLSREQKAWTDQKIADAELGHLVEVLLMDYRELELPESEEERFDKVVSIEMIEAVGEKGLRGFFERVDALVKRRGGIVVLQGIVMPEGRHEEYSKREDFINRYIFPGGYLPSTTQLINHITAASTGTLIIERIENIGGHYARTLRLWRERFLANFDSKIKPALTRENPNWTEGDVEVFRRKWEYYFSYCEAGFMTKTLGDVIITVGREGTMELMEGIPL